jgi:hypothetical protein
MYRQKYSLFFLPRISHCSRRCSRLAYPQQICPRQDGGLHGSGFAQRFAMSGYSYALGSHMLRFLPDIET